MISYTNLGAAASVFAVSFGLAPVTCAQDSGNVTDQATIVPASPDMRFARHVVGADGGSAGAAGERLVYSNTLGAFAAALGAGRLVADDISINAPNGCSLRRLEFPVVGKVDPAGIGGPYIVEFALYDNCPGAVPSASRPALIIPGTAGSASFPDDAPRLISFVVPPGGNVPIPTNVWLGMTFNRNNAGPLMGAPALVGFSSDTFDFPGFACGATVGGFPEGPHASFNAEVYVEAGCPEAFLGYRANKPSGGVFNPGANLTLGDDIKLGVEECQMVAYEVALKGVGFYTFDLRNRCDGAPIPGTSKSFTIPSGTNVRIARLRFDPSIPLPKNLWFSTTVNNATGGAIVAGVQPDIGETDDSVEVIDPSGRCQLVDVPGTGLHAALHFSITCAGPPPVGACCDMVFTECVGGSDDGRLCCPEDSSLPPFCPYQYGGLGNVFPSCAAPGICESVCHEVPAMNCAWPPRFTDLEPKWVDGATCDPDPFPFPCGAAACCRPDQVCENLTHNECYAVPPLESERQWQRGRYCNLNEQRCPWIACLSREGDCLAAHREGGCGDAECCTDVCNTDSYCCVVEWDTICIREAQTLCSLGPRNDECADPGWPQAIEIVPNASAVVSNANATQNPTDPVFTCNRDGSGIQGFHTTWFVFEAMDASARIHTCNTDPSAQDTLVAIYHASDPSTPQTACASLSEIACSDDTVGCGTDVSSDICITALVPGQRYYIQVATHSEEDRGVFELDIESPCPVFASASQGIALTEERRPASIVTGVSPTRRALGPTTPAMNVSLLYAARPLEPSAPGNRAGGREIAQLVRIDITNISQLRTLAAFHDAHRDVEIWSEALGIGPIDVRLSSLTRQALDATGLSYRVLVEDLDSQRQALLSAPAGADFFDAYRSYDEHVVFMNDLVTAYPHLAEMINLGSSVEGRYLWAIRITGPGDGKSAVLYHGAQHGNEIMGAANIAFIARRLLTDYGADEEVTALVDNVEWFLLPIMNPDGYVDGNRYNANGADLNRNWGGPGAYPGAFSQPETAALRDFLAVHPNVRAHVDLHSSGFMILWPWGHTAELSENHVTFDFLGTEMAERIVEVRGTTYPYRGPVYTTIYPVNGGSIDYSYGELGLWSFGFEIGYAFHMPTFEIVPTSEEMFQSLAFLSEWVFDCNGNGVADADEIARGESDDCNGNNTPDECEQQPDFDADGEVDICDADIDNDGVLNAADVCDRTSLGTLIHTDGRPLSDTSGNCDVDWGDFWRFRNCLVNGRLGFPAPVEACHSFFDYDGDGNINLRDFAGFQNAFRASGP